MKLPRTTIHTDDRAAQEGDRRRNAVETAVNEMAIPSGARTVSGLTFTAGQTRDIAHGLRQKAIGYFLVNAQTGIPLVYRTVQGAELEKRLIRLTHTGAWTTFFDLVVW